MPERFHVSAEEQVRIPHESIRETVSAIFRKMGEPASNAETAANTLVTADLWGTETHGVSNMVRYYIEYYGKGEIKADPQWHIVRETPSTAVMDADRGLAIILGKVAMQTAIDKAKDVGVGMVTLINAGHSGALGVHAAQAANQGLIGMVMTAGGARMVPTFGAEGRLGTDPIAFAAPARHEAPFIFDAAMSSVAHNKIRIAQRLGSDILPGWLAEDDGTPIMDERPAPDGDSPLLLPFGGSRAIGSHKGYGLGLMVTIMTTLLPGMQPTMVSGTKGGEHLFAAYDIEAFADPEEFKTNMDDMLRTLRETPPAPEADRVVYAGLPEYENEQDRRANGVPLHNEVVAWFDDIASELEVPPLRRM